MIGETTKSASTKSSEFAFDLPPRINGASPDEMKSEPAPMLTWAKYSTYGAAENAKRCLYVFKKGHAYLYIGKAKQFGGTRGRYAYGYRYLVEALLKANVTLYIALLSDQQWAAVKDYENTLINSAKGRMAVNRRRVKNFRTVAGLRGP